MNITETAKNRALTERLGAFSAQEPFRLMPEDKPAPGGRPEPGPAVEPVEFLADGSAVLRMAADPDARVAVSTGRLSAYRFEGEMRDRGDGVFEITIPANTAFRGNTVLEFSVNGASVVHPFLPVQIVSGHICNCIEVPDWETPYVLMRDVPHGAVTREVFWSETIQDYARCFVYTPPMYSRGGDYPVLYLQHGAGENETCWTFNGKTPHILDNLIADGKCVPFIVVMNNGMLKKPGQTGQNDEVVEGIICEDCRRYIEERYRVRRDKWGCAVAGLSLGSVQASYIGLRHPELFSAIGAFTFICRRDSDHPYEGKPYLDALKDPERFWKDYKAFFRSVGGAEAQLKGFEEDDVFLRQCGIDAGPNYHRHIYPGMAHNWNCWRRALCDFAQVIFQWGEME